MKTTLLTTIAVLAMLATPAAAADWWVLLKGPSQEMTECSKSAFYRSPADVFVEAKREGFFPTIGEKDEMVAIEWSRHDRATNETIQLTVRMFRSLEACERVAKVNRTKADDQLKAYR